MTVNEEKSKNDDTPDKKDEKVDFRKFFITLIIFTGLVAFLSAFIKIPITLNLYWITLTYYLYFTPLLIYTIGIMFRSWIAFVMGTLGVILGEMIYCLAYGCSGELPYYLIFALVSRGAEVLLISLLRKKNELLAMLVGGLWVLIGLLLVYYLYYYRFLYWDLTFVILYAIISALLDLIFIPFSFLLNMALRKALNVKYLEELLYNT